ncbi:hypothetical protein QTO34_000479 [Cnephaeus nilssonii]|uniref:Uncharacterized protein n=1 Tax=Cnephaeus nilssonii TaxID=3371016 RepID=A0AA40LUQ0_CNENI|nr:hypothetical protein QTO34_000479 [Eptesicus nilssonii]
MVWKLGESQSFIKKYHPDKEVANCVNSFNDNAVFHFRQVLKCRQKQTSLDSFLVIQRPTEAEGGTPGGLSTVDKIKMAVPSGRARAAAPLGCLG